MRTQLLLFLLLLVAWGTQAQTVIQSQSFEAGEAVNYTSNSFNYNTIGGTTAQNGNQYFQRVTETTTTATIPSNFWPLIPVSGGALNGTYFWAGEATQGRSNTPIRGPGYVALNSVSVAGYTNLQVKVALLDPRGATNTFLDKDTLKVQVRLNGTGPWVLLGQFISDNPTNGGNLRQDLNLSGVYDAADATGGMLNATMTDYIFSVGSSASTLVTRVVSSSQSLSSEIGFDNIRVLGTVATSQAPVLANFETTSLPYNEGDPATQLTNTLTVADPDNTTAAGATVSLTTGFNSTEDRLLFVNQNGITGSFNTSTGVLTLSGPAALATYQAALRSVQYQNIDAADASPATRTVVFSLTDPAGVVSAPVNRTITITTHLDAATGLPYTEDFESNGEGTRYATNHFINGNNNFAFTRTNVNPFNPGTQGTTVGLTTFSNLSNSYYWYSDATRNGANPSTVKNGTFTTKPLNTAGYANLQFQLRVGASAPNATPNPSTWLTTDYFKLYYRVAGTSTWTVFGSFRGTSTTVGGVGSLKQDTDPTAAPGSAAPTGTTVTTALATFTFALPASLSGQTLELQLVVANQDGTSDLAYDLLQLTGTPVAAPTVTTAAASSITSTSAALGGNVTADGGATVTARGVVYSVSSTNATPTIGGTGVTQDSNGSGAGTYLKTITGLAAGTSYTVRAYALNSVGTSYGSAVTFTTTAALSTTGSQTNIACNGSASGSATVTASGGLPPYTYSWSTSPVQTAATVTGLVAGTYTVTVTDASGATTSRTFTITQPNALAATTSQNNVTTNGGSNGSATLTVSGGTPTYTYSWSPSVSTTTTASNLSAGTYTVTATDANGCTITRTFTITQPAATTAAPVVTAPANGSLLNTNTPSYSGTAPAGSTVTVYVDGTSLGTTPATASGSFSFLQPTNLADGAHMVYATAQASGNTVSANSNTNTFTVDATVPMVAITSTASSPTTTSPIPLTVTFSEAVLGFTAGKVTVDNGTVSSFAGSGTTYTFTVTPVGEGLVTVQVAANVAQDAAGNGNTAAVPFSIRYSAPVTLTSWTGSISTDWFTAGNWTAGVPTSTLDALIPVVSSGIYPRLNAGTANAAALTLNAGAQLRLEGGALMLMGNFVNNGTFSATAGVLSLNGNTAQRLGGSSTLRFTNLTIGPAGAALTGPVEMGAGVLTLSGNLTTNGNALVLLSTPTGDALVVNNGGVVLGNTAVQRAIDNSLNSGLGYRHYSAPVSTSTVADLATGGFTPVVNPAYNTSATPTTERPFPTVYGYDQSRLTLANNLVGFDKGYFSPASLAEPLLVGRGYTVNLTGGQLVDFVGTLTNGNVTLNLAREAVASEAGWHLVGNPYPAPLDWRLVAPADRLNLDGSIYVYSSTSQYAGQYRAYINGIGGNPVLPMGQAFFVRVSSGQTSGTLTFRNNQRLTMPDGTTFQRTTAETRPQVQLTLTGTSGTDAAYVYFEAGATPSLDAAYDAVKLPNTTGLNLSATVGGQELAINGLPQLTTAVVVPLKVAVPGAGTYTLRAAELLNLATTGVYLRDLVTGQEVNLRQQPSYTFSTTSTTLTERFVLRFTPSLALATQAGFTEASVAMYPNPAHQRTMLLMPAVAGASQFQANVYNVLGQAVRSYTRKLPTTGAQLELELTGLPVGVYSVRVQAGAITVTKRLLVE